MMIGPADYMAIRGYLARGREVQLAADWVPPGPRLRYDANDRASVIALESLPPVTLYRRCAGLRLHIGPFCIVEARAYDFANALRRHQTQQIRFLEFGRSPYLNSRNWKFTLVARTRGKQSKTPRACERFEADATAIVKAAWLDMARSYPLFAATTRVLEIMPDGGWVEPCAEMADDLGYCRGLLLEWMTQRIVSDPIGIMDYPTVRYETTPKLSAEATSRVRVLLHRRFNRRLTRKQIAALT